MRRLQTRLLLAVFGVALTAAIAVAVAARQGARHEFLKFQDLERHSVMARRAELTAAIAGDLDGRCCSGQTLADAARRLDADEALVLLASDGRTIVGAAGRAIASAKAASATFDGRTLRLELTEAVGDRLGRVSLQFAIEGHTLSMADGRQATAFVVPMPSDAGGSPTDDFFGSLDRRLLLATAVVGGLALIGTWLATRAAVGPIEELRHATEDLASGNLGRRVSTSGPEEVAALAAAFNAMAAELESQRRLRQDLIHDVAHELRTPLTALRCRLETVQDGLSEDPGAAIGRLHEQVLHLSTLVDDLQDLALAESRELRLEPRDIEVSPLVESAIRAAGLESDRRVQRAVPPGLVLHGDAVRMRQVLTNLLTNARRHTPPDGTIAVRGAREVSGVAIEVRNTGSRLDPDQLARVFDRFYRTDPSRQRDTGGTGLGLAIVKHLVEAQGGRVWATSDEAGVTFGCAVPASAATPSPAPVAPPARSSAVSGAE